MKNQILIAIMTTVTLLAVGCGGGSGGSSAPDASFRNEADHMPSATNTTLVANDGPVLVIGQAKTITLTLLSANGKALDLSKSNYKVDLQANLAAFPNGKLSLTDMTKVSGNVYTFTFTPSSDAGVSIGLMIQGEHPYVSQVPLVSDKLALRKFDGCLDAAVFAETGLRRVIENGDSYELICGVSDMHKVKDANRRAIRNIRFMVNIDMADYYNAYDVAASMEPVAGIPCSPCIPNTWGSLASSYDSRITPSNDTAAVTIDGNGKIITGVMLFSSDSTSPLSDFTGLFNFVANPTNYIVKNMTVNTTYSYSDSYAGNQMTATATATAFFPSKQRNHYVSYQSVGGTATFEFSNVTFSIATPSMSLVGSLALHSSEFTNSTDTSDTYFRVRPKP